MALINNFLLIFSQIPFSKFFLSSKGRIQDKQTPIPLNKVVSVGISAGDRSNAPFRLEIDYIGLYKDPDHTETFAYEMYQHDKFFLGSWGGGRVCVHVCVQ